MESICPQEHNKNTSTCEAILTENWLETGGKTLVKKKKKTKKQKKTQKKHTPKTQKILLLKKNKKHTESGRKAWGTIRLGPAPLGGVCYIKLLKGKACNWKVVVESCEDTGILGPQRRRIQSRDRDETWLLRAFV